MNKCPICNEYLIWSTHTCDPCFYVWSEDEEIYDVYESKYHKIFAKDAERAAIQYAENDYELPNRMVLNVISKKNVEEILDLYPDEEDFSDDVLLLIASKTEKFQLDSEMTRNFYASKL